ncbi:hypothetical protein J6590_068841, partial [Homalodisca vitripennis]
GDAANAAGSRPTHTNTHTTHTLVTSHSRNVAALPSRRVTLYLWGSKPFLALPHEKGTLGQNVRGVIFAAVFCNFRILPVSSLERLLPYAG